jgi:glycosyltransferase involved in cell wall biosynthesis
LNFLIATKSKLDIDERIQKLLDTGRLFVFEGKPMTNEEINYHYKSSFAVWNAYNYTTQSGVLAKSFMFGTPAIVMCKNLSEFVENNREVVAIDDNNSYSEISEALYEIISNYDKYSDAARTCFVDNFYYRTHNKKMVDILKKLKNCPK